METKENYRHKKCSKPNVIWITSPWTNDHRPYDFKRRLPSKNKPAEDFNHITNKQLDKQADQYEKERKL
jgi:hypothetical protein